MSIKLYHGLKMELMPLDQLLSFCKRIQTQAIKARNQFIREAWTAESYKENWMKIWDACIEEQARGRTSILDFHFEATFIPISDKLLILPFGPQHEIDVLVDAPEVQPYGYWNNTDPDENCSEEEWNQRELDWREGLINCSPPIPSHNGFTFEFVSKDIPFPHQVFEYKEESTCD